MPIGFVGPALQGANFIGRVGVPLLQQAGITAGLAGLGAAASALSGKNKPQPKPQRPRFQPVSSDQLPPGAYMNEAGRVFGLSSEQVGAAGGYMDETGRVFVPSAATRFGAPQAQQRVAAPSPVSSPVSAAPAPVSTRPRSAVSSVPAAERAYQQEKSRVAQLTAQDPDFQRYEAARKLAVGSNATPAQVQAAEDIGMAMWAKANPKLAAKVKPGQSGYEVIKNELNAGTMGPVTNFPFDTTRPLSPTPIPPEQQNVSYAGVNPVSLGAMPSVTGAQFPTNQAAMFERFQQTISPSTLAFQGSPLGTAQPQIDDLSYGGQVQPIGNAVTGDYFNNEKARNFAELLKMSQLAAR